MHGGPYSLRQADAAAPQALFSEASAGSNVSLNMSGLLSDAAGAPAGAGAASERAASGDLYETGASSASATAGAAARSDTRADAHVPGGQRSCAPTLAAPAPAQPQAGGASGHLGRDAEIKHFLLALEEPVRWPSGQQRCAWECSDFDYVAREAAQMREKWGIDAGAARAHG